jgi:hypothetical protein
MTFFNSMIFKASLLNVFYYTESKISLYTPHPNPLPQGEREYIVTPLP